MVVLVSILQSTQKPPEKLGLFVKQLISKIPRNSIRLVPWRLRDKIKFVPGIALLQRYILAQFVHGSECIQTISAGPVKGLTYPVLLPEDKGVWTGTSELDFVASLRNAVKTGAVYFDVGGLALVLWRSDGRQWCKTGRNFRTASH